MKKFAVAFIVIVTCSAFQGATSLKGNWIFVGGIYNGKKEGAPKEYSLQRKYQDNKFDAYLLEKGQKPQKYQSGNYLLKPDTCLETETYSAQPSKLTGKTVHYHYQLRRDTLILQAVLPTGMQVEEYWKKQR
ncbi:hypothetical protein HQ865_09335 [Mucilaginibacter mali]|uniref:Lipocalin-like domain-containing protein n=1 Tax=Mucilaginibacter mali TaxID=2740462 RepID=A0A7D4PTF7_9SPHI|nr:hypothetical protein [Mucilaginibacter mali]QKJ29948.1 hypothetical protein HQ865_09335 [Mucilaginibacter mali]